MDLKPVRIVLVEPSHPGNIGASARAMKTMGLSDLALVEPLFFPHPDATARASGADDVLDSARVFDSLDAALTGREFVFGVSARQRSIRWPCVSPDAAAVRTAGELRGHSVAFVFGRESSGLENAELERCNALVTIPAAPDYPSLNLAAAVQVVAYEIRRAHADPPPVDDPADGDAVTADELESLYSHLERVMIATGFLDPDNPRRLMRRLRRLFGRARPDRDEFNILRGLLSSVERPTGRKHGQ